MHDKTRQPLRNLLNANQGNGSETTFLAGSTKVTLKNMKI